MGDRIIEIGVTQPETGQLIAALWRQRRPQFRDPVQGLTFLQKSSWPSMQVDSSKFGYPGIKSELHILAIKGNEQSTDEERLYDISLRDFIVSGRLSKAPIANDTIKGDFTKQDGNLFSAAAFCWPKGRNAAGRYVRNQ